MDYEKKYNEALERASKLRVQNPFETVSQMMEHVFPELADSEEERIRKRLIRYFSTFRLGTFAGIEPKKIIDWLEKQGEKNPGWSEEDEDAIGMAIIALEDMYDEDEPNSTYGGYNLPFNKAAERLKSLRPQTTWKPSEEQMEVLKEVTNIAGGKYKSCLNSLCQDLKKLKGE